MAVFEDQGFLLLAPTTGSSVPATDAILKTLSACASWTPIDQVPLEENGVEYLLRVGLLVEDGTRAAEQDVSIRSWEAWGQETVSYHFRARRQFLDHPIARTLEDALGAIKGPPPSMVKRYPNLPRMALPPIAPLNADFETTLRRRCTWREFAQGPLPLEQCATLLGLAFGATAVIDAHPFGRVLSRTSPSAGARHPVEAYICASNVEGLTPGVYHYSVLDHALEQLDVSVPPSTLVSYMCDTWVGDAPLVGFLTAVVDRSRWKYPFGRMYRTLLLDVGHIAQTFVLTATALGLAPFQVAAFQDPLIENALGLDPAKEPVLHAVGAGLLPSRAVSER